MGGRLYFDIYLMERASFPENIIEYLHEGRLEPESDDEHNFLQ